MKSKGEVKEFSSQELMSIETENVDMEAIKAMDNESNYRKLKGKAGMMITAIAVSMSLFQLYTSGFGLLQARLQRSIHLAFAMALIFLLFPGSKKSPKGKFTAIDMIWAAVGVTVNMYIVINFQALAYRAGNPNGLDIIMAVLAVITVLEAGRRVVGIDLPILGMIFIAYAFFGRYLPWIFAHRGYSISRISEYMYLTLEGIYSTPLSVAATYVFLFVLFGVLASKTGLGQLFIDIALAIAGKTTGGPAKVSVISSGLMGSINGSSIANTVTTGAFTIPLMKNMGYKARFAGAVEAAASTGGQIMPPIMGAAAFIMSEFLGIPYTKIIVAAIIPAALYYLAVGTMVHLEAAKNDLKGLERVPHLFNLLKTKGYLLIPLFIIIWQLVNGYTPLSAGFYGSIASIVIYLIEKVMVDKSNSNGYTGAELAGTCKAWGKDIVECLEEGAKASLGVTASCAAVGFIVGTCTLTGLGLTFAGMTVNLAGNVVSALSAIGLGFMDTPGVLLFFTLFFTMLACTILGSGIPTTATYIILAMIAAPALEKLGVTPLAAHLFVLYFGVVADLTPPVALAAYAGAGIAGSNPFWTGFTAVKLALAGFIVPYIFVYNPEILMQEPVGIVVLAQIIITCVLGILALGAGAEGYLRTDTNIIERVLLFVAAIMLLMVGVKSDLMGAAMLALVFATQTMRKKKNLETLEQKAA